MTLTALSVAMDIFWCITLRGTDKAPKNAINFAGFNYILEITFYLSIVNIILKSLGFMFCANVYRGAI